MEGVALSHFARKSRAVRVGNCRPNLPFRSVNVRGQPDYQADMQRHHLLPRQLLGTRGLSGMFAQLGRERIGFDDFRRNGLLLPASIAAALLVGLPMHRGPHRSHNAMVADRVGQIEADWSRKVGHCSGQANGEAVLRLDLLQRALRRRLLEGGQGRLMLNRKDPSRSGQDFTQLDAMVDQLWAGTEPAG